jgi:putative peptidoglycan lipid II flippase
MKNRFWQKSLDLLNRRQTNILSAAFVIMATVILSQVLGLIKKRLLIAYFGAGSVTGVYDVAYKLPDLLFQLIVASALSSAFIPIFSQYITKDKQEEANKVASNLISLGLLVFFGFSIILAIFAPFFLAIFNPGGGFSPSDMMLMTNLMRIIILGEFFIIIGTFLTALLQSYNHFFVSGFALALYNLGIIIGLVCLSHSLGIYSGAIGTVIGGLIFILVQIPAVKRVGFSYHPSFSFRNRASKTMFHLMWPRTISNAIYYLGSILIVSLVSFLPATGRNYVIFDLAQTIAFAPVALIGQAIAQAAFPVLSREKDNPENFKHTFINSFNQMLYLILPISVLILVLRIPVVRLVFGAPRLDWDATVLTGQTLAYFSISIFAQALITLVLRGYYALHDTKTPLIIGTIATGAMLALAYIFIVVMQHMPICFTPKNCIPNNIEALGLAYTIASILQLVVLFLLLEKKIGGFKKRQFFVPWMKIFFCTLFTAFALYIPIKILDKLVIDTTYTIGLIILTGISSLAGITIYLLLTWIFKIKEAQTYVLALKKIRSWKEILNKSQEVIEGKINQ